MQPNSKRTNHLELPTGSEIMSITNAEEKRSLPRERQLVHFPDFETIRAIYDHFGLDTSLFDERELSASTVLDEGAKQVHALSKLILDNNTNQPCQNLFDAAYDYLAETDKPEAADAIFVFGAPTPARILTAIELYHQGLAPKLIVSGKGPYYGSNESITEAGKYADIAVHAGIPAHAIIVEAASITIPDNVRRTLNLLDTLQQVYQSIIIVNLPYTQRRGWCVWKKHTPEGTTIYRVNSATVPQYRRGQWSKNIDGLNLILGEFIKLRVQISFNDS
ncbi:YdcF family protein [Candidatus Saccharibacteria bacterium]|nr:YdcF family protein [Candidatus Saccharibacteria bacterium]